MRDACSFTVPVMITPHSLCEVVGLGTERVATVQGYSTVPHLVRAGEIQRKDSYVSIIP
jgi:hypothetical protein